jgi:hypothetical protein
MANYFCNVLLAPAFTRLLLEKGGGKPPQSIVLSDGRGHGPTAILQNRNGKLA